MKNSLSFSVFCVALALLFTFQAHAAKDPVLIPFWNASDESNNATIDHSDWQNLLDTYLVKDHVSGINRFNYGALKANLEDMKALKVYLFSMTALDARQYARAEQLPYWINLYNALTIIVVTDDYPVKSIKEIKSGFINFGPWDKVLISIKQKRLTLNNIEHGILRPIWKDARLHYAINCASLGCPNLSPEAYRRDNTERLLEQSSKDYINHPRGASVEGDTLTVSSIYDWFKVDFGGTDESVIEHLLQYAEPELAEQIKNFTEFDDDYDWSLNGI